MSPPYRHTVAAVTHAAMNRSCDLRGSRDRGKGRVGVRDGARIGSRDASDGRIRRAEDERRGRRAFLSERASAPRGDGRGASGTGAHLFLSFCARVIFLRAAL